MTITELNRRRTRSESIRFDLIVAQEAENGIAHLCDLIGQAWKML
jgi:hypothetical protein